MESELVIKCVSEQPVLCWPHIITKQISLKKTPNNQPTVFSIPTN